MGRRGELAKSASIYSYNNSANMKKAKIFSCKACLVKTW